MEKGKRTQDRKRKIDRMLIQQTLFHVDAPPSILVVHLSVVGQFTIVVGVDNSQDIKWIPYVFQISALAPNKYCVTLETQFSPKTPPTKKLSSGSKGEMNHRRQWFAPINSQFSSSSSTHIQRVIILFIDWKVSQITLILIGSLFFIISRSAFQCRCLILKYTELVHSAMCLYVYNRTLTHVPNKVQLKLDAHLFTIIIIIIIKPNLFAFIYAIGVGFSRSLSLYSIGCALCTLDYHITFTTKEQRKCKREWRKHHVCACVCVFMCVCVFVHQQTVNTFFFVRIMVVCCWLDVRTFDDVVFVIYFIFISCFSLFLCGKNFF